MTSRSNVKGHVLRVLNFAFTSAVGTTGVSINNGLLYYLITTTKIDDDYLIIRYTVNTFSNCIACLQKRWDSEHTRHFLRHPDYKAEVNRQIQPWNPWLQLGNQWKETTRNNAWCRHLWSIAWQSPRAQERLGKVILHMSGLQTGNDSVTYFLGHECQPLPNLTAFIPSVYKTQHILLHIYTHSRKGPLTSQGGVVH